MQTCRNGIRKVNALNLERAAKSNKKESYTYIGQKRQGRECVSLLINEKGEMATTDTRKAEVLTEFFVPVFTDSQAPRVSHILEPLGRWVLQEQNPS